MALARKRKERRRICPPDGMKYSVGGHSFVPIDPNANVTPSPTTNGTTNGTTVTENIDVHQQLIDCTENRSVDSPLAERSNKQKAVPTTVLRKKAKNHQIVE